MSKKDKNDEIEQIREQSGMSAKQLLQDLLKGNPGLVREIAAMAQQEEAEPEVKAEPKPQAEVPSEVEGPKGRVLQLVAEPEVKAEEPKVIEEPEPTPEADLSRVPYYGPKNKKGSCCNQQNRKARPAKPEQLYPCSHPGCPVRGTDREMSVPSVWRIQTELAKDLGKKPKAVTVTAKDLIARALCGQHAELHDHRLKSALWFLGNGYDPKKVRLPGERKTAKSGYVLLPVTVNQSAGFRERLDELRAMISPENELVYADGDEQKKVKVEQVRVRDDGRLFCGFIPGATACKLESHLEWLGKQIRRQGQPGQAKPRFQNHGLRSAHPWGKPPEAKAHRGTKTRQPKKPEWIRDWVTTTLRQMLDRAANLKRQWVKAETQREIDLLMEQERWSEAERLEASLEASLESVRVTPEELKFMSDYVRDRAPKAYEREQERIRKEARERKKAGRKPRRRPEPKSEKKDKGKKGKKGKGKKKG